LSGPTRRSAPTGAAPVDSRPARDACPPERARDFPHLRLRGAHQHVPEASTVE
jgi:hypothetical protein